ncbi:MAG TPA: FAD-dependent oxidoreductase [Xanthobacteraceae bacterium]|nr:FAD-dependent oxidoreductase [Xanthobacteraceae bacterium]
MAQDISELTPDICVIGAGAGGMAAAAAAAAMGVPVVLIEKGRMGGQSLYCGSVPSKALLAAAGRASALQTGARFGIKSARFAVDFGALGAHVRDAVAAITPQDSAERFTGLGVRVVAGVGRFRDPGTVEVGDVTVKARRFIIATGSSPIIPAIAGLADAPYLTPETVFDLADWPRHLIVIGAGRTGLELAQTFRRLGSDLTVLEAATPLAREDRECATVVLDALAREGVRLRTGVQIAQVRRMLARIQVVLTKSDDATAGEETIEGSHLLLAAGRHPNVKDLNLEAAGIRYDPQGVVVDKGLRTTNKKVYAIGDVIGGAKFAHIANHHASLVIRNALFRHPVAVDHRAVPRVIFTDPELAQVGFQEDDARRQAGAIRILRWPYRENDRAVTAAATDGHIKVITDRRGGILGATIVGAAAGENITAWALAIGQKLNIGAFAGLVVPYPTYAEVGKRAAITYFMRGLTSTRVRRIMGWLRRFG